MAARNRKKGKVALVLDMHTFDVVYQNTRSNQEFNTSCARAHKLRINEWLAYDCDVVGRIQSYENLQHVIGDPSISETVRQKKINWQICSGLEVHNLMLWESIQYEERKPIYFKVGFDQEGKEAMVEYKWWYNMPEESTAMYCASVVANVARVQFPYTRWSPHKAFTSLGYRSILPDMKYVSKVTKFFSFTTGLGYDTLQIQAMPAEEFEKLLSLHSFANKAIMMAARNESGNLAHNPHRADPSVVPTQVSKNDIDKMGSMFGGLGGPSSKLENDV